MTAETIEIKRGLETVAVRHLALRLAEAEHSLHALAAGGIDAIVDPSGKTYLLRPAQEHLRQNEKRLQAVIESSADVITVVNRGGAILSQSYAVMPMLGFPPEELVGTSIFELIHGDDLSAVHSAFFNVIEGFRENAVVEFRHRTREGSYRRLEATLSKLRDLSEPSVVLTCRDITRRTPGHEQAIRRKTAREDASHAKDQFLAIPSHELLTPLTPALLGLQALEADERFEEAKPALAMIRQNIELQARLIENLLDFSRITDGTLPTKLESIDAHAAVRNVLVKTAGAAEPPVAPRPPPAPARLRILLVEDHADTRAVLARLLEHRGHIVFAAKDSASALQLAETCEVELLISDIGLPDGSGYDLMERLQRTQPSLQGISVSGLGLPGDLEQSRTAGFSEHLVKPIDIESLQSAIQTVVAETGAVAHA